jgi:hypothetical protein
MIDQNQVATYLAQGFKPAKVAAMVGCSEPTLSELIRTEKFQQLYEPLKAQYANDRVDKAYGDLEEKALGKLKEAMEFAEIPMLTKVLDSINRYRQTKLPQASAGITNQSLISITKNITLQLPNHAKSNLVVNERGEIISFGDRSLAPLSSLAVQEVFKEIANEQLTAI